MANTRFSGRELLGCQTNKPLPTCSTRWAMTHTVHTAIDASPKPPTPVDVASSRPALAGALAFLLVWWAGVLAVVDWRCWRKSR